ncbi:MAG: pyridoxamine 5'-phosphate oxidase family protein [Deltaproteobacteria bacterium]|nr:pyridoxamine 5'-phosphate oxidase family protein [Deltaproteobacteria bacterium]
MKAEAVVEGIVRKLGASQRLAVLSTENLGQPYSSLIAFALGEDLKSLVFTTPRLTRKFSNLTANPHVSLLIDDRSNRREDFHEARAATILGRAREVAGEERESCLELFLGKHPYLSDFARSPETTIFRVEIETYYVVDCFQAVSELHIRR